MIRIFLAFLFVLGVSGPVAQAATLFEADVDVFAQLNSPFEGPGGQIAAELAVGDMLSISTDPKDLWSLRGGLREFSSAAGNASLGLYTLGDFTAAEGALVGQIADGAFFLIGTDYSARVDSAGFLALYAWDRVPGDNGGFITARVLVTQAELASLPLPGGGFSLTLAILAVWGTRRIVRKMPA